MHDAFVLDLLVVSASEVDMGFRAAKPARPCISHDGSSRSGLIRLEGMRSLRLRVAEVIGIGLNVLWLLHPRLAISTWRSRGNPQAPLLRLAPIRMGLRCGSHSARRILGQLMLKLRVHSPEVLNLLLAALSALVVDPHPFYHLRELVHLLVRTISVTDVLSYFEFNGLGRFLCRFSGFASRSRLPCLFLGDSFI